MLNKKAYLVRRNWPLYLIGILVTSLTVSLGVNAWCKPKEKEKIVAFAPVYSADASTFVNEVKSVTSSLIREVDLEHGVPGENTTYTLFSAYYDVVDFYILPASWMDKINTISAHFEESTIHTLIPSSTGRELYADENGYYGVEVYDAETDTGAMKAILSYYNETSEKENYYLVFRLASCHIGSLNTGSFSDDSLVAANHLLSL